MSGKCQYKAGQYCSGDNYDNCNSDGCTVSLLSSLEGHICLSTADIVTNASVLQVSVSSGSAAYVFS